MIGTSWDAPSTRQQPFHGRQRLAQRVAGLLNVAPYRYQWRHQADHIGVGPAFPGDQSPVERRQAHGGADFGGGRASRRAHLETEHGADAAQIAGQGRGLEGFPMGLDPGSDGPGLGTEIPVDDLAQRRGARGGGYRVQLKGRGLRAPGPSGQYLQAPGHQPPGKAAAHALAHEKQIGRDAGYLAGKETSGPPEPGEDLVQNQGCAGLSGRGGDRFEEAARRDDDAGRRLDRLHDDTGQGLGCTRSLGDGPNGRGGRGGCGGRIVFRPRVGGEFRGRGERPQFGVGALGMGHGQSPQGPAVIAAGEGEKSARAGEMHTGLERRLRRFGSVGRGMDPS